MPVWPDAGMTGSPIFSQICSNGSNSLFLDKNDVSKSPKSPGIWATFVRKFVIKNFQISPNLVTLVGTLVWKLTSPRRHFDPDASSKLFQNFFADLFFVYFLLQFCYSILFLIFLNLMLWTSRSSNHSILFVSPTKNYCNPDQETSCDHVAANGRWSLEFTQCQTNCGYCP